MSEKLKRSVIYFEHEIHHALHTMAAQMHRSVSEVVNEAVRLALRENSQDLSACNERSDEPTLSYDALLKNLKSHGKV